MDEKCTVETVTPNGIAAEIMVGRHSGNLSSAIKLRVYIVIISEKGDRHLLNSIDHL